MRDAQVCLVVAARRGGDRRSRRHRLTGSHPGSGVLEGRPFGDHINLADPRHGTTSRRTHQRPSPTCISRRRACAWIDITGLPRTSTLTGAVRNRRSSSHGNRRTHERATHGRTRPTRPRPAPRPARSRRSNCPTASWPCGGRRSEPAWTITSHNPAPRSTISRTAGVWKCPAWTAGRNDRPTASRRQVAAGRQGRQQPAGAGDRRRLQGTSDRHG